MRSQRERYLAVLRGTDLEDEVRAFQAAFHFALDQVARRGLPQEITLLVPTLGNFDTGWAERAIGTLAARKLTTGKPVIHSGFTIRPATCKSSQHSCPGVLLVLWADEKMIEAVEKSFYFAVLVVVPWEAEIGEAWLSKWSARRLLDNE